MLLDLIETELTRVRRKAEHADDNGYLLYLLDMAILEANRRARSLAENRRGPILEERQWRVATTWRQT